MVGNHLYPNQTSRLLNNREGEVNQQPYILIVDDDPDILEGIITILETQPYRLATARDGKR